MRLRKKAWAEPLIKKHTGDIIVSNEASSIKKLEDDFLRNNENILEIGTGKGDFITGLALKNPNINYLGIELSETILAVVLKKTIELKLKNIRLINMNAKDLGEMLNPNLFDKIHLNFSDPWPKNRHESRRLTSKNFLESYKKLLKTGGKLILKTDNAGLFDFSLTSLKENNWTLETVNYDYPLNNNNQDVETEYENRFRNLGQKIHYLIASYKEVKEDE